MCTAGECPECLSHSVRFKHYTKISYRDVEKKCSTSTSAKLATLKVENSYDNLTYKGEGEDR